MQHRKQQQHISILYSVELWIDIWPINDDTQLISTTPVNNVSSTVDCP